MAICPKCNETIPTLALKCGCGWELIRSKSAPDFHGPTATGSAIIKRIRAMLKPREPMRERQPGEDDE